MQYSTEIVINRPLARVIELFDNPALLKEWQPGLQQFEPLSGTPGQPGAKTRMVYKMGSRTVQLTETIVMRNLPQEFTATYETKGVYNIVKNRFAAVDANTTHYVTENEFRLSGFMKILGWLMPGSFKKESYKYQQQFKAFVEKQGS
jgi:carbon monoxide dehydrogenase subunit G